VRVDTGISVGDVIPPDYDSMVAKIIAWGATGRRPSPACAWRCARRPSCCAAAPPRSPSCSTCSTARGRLRHRRHRLARPHRRGSSAEPPPYAHVALLQVAVDVYDAEEGREQAAFLASARGGRPRARHEVGRELELGYRGQVYRLAVASSGPDRYRVGLDGREVDVVVDRLSTLESRLTVAGDRHSVVSVQAAASYLVEVDGISHRVSQDEAGVVRAPAPAVVVAVRVEVGQDVEAGQTVAVLESMKMETPVRAPSAGRVREVLAAVNAQVDAGAPLLRLDRVDDDAAASTGERIVLPLAGDGDGAPAGRRLALLDTLQALLTGYDVRAERVPSLLDAYAARAAACPSTTPTCCTPSWRCSRPSPTSPSCRATADDRRGGRRRAGAQPARVLPRLPALARHRPRGLPRRFRAR
jgi:biotin carboxyl carrier protein